MGGLSIWHWLIVLAVVLLLFGGSGKVSTLMGDFAKGVKSFKRNMADDESMEAQASHTSAAPHPAPGSLFATPAPTTNGTTTAIVLTPSTPTAVGSGGTLAFTMGAAANTNWGAGVSSQPPSYADGMNAALAQRLAFDPNGIAVGAAQIEHRRQVLMGECAEHRQLLRDPHQAPVARGDAVAR